MDQKLIPEDFQWVKAVDIARFAHGDQKYGDYPYIVHLIEVDNFVTKMLYKSTGPCDQFVKEPMDRMDKLRAIAFLHDVIEDTDVTLEDLREKGICEDVVYAVNCMTKIDGQPYIAYIDVVNSCELARLVKLCDTIANLYNSIKAGNAYRINKYTKQIQLLGGFQ